MYELHFAVPMAGAILCAFNSRLDSCMVSTLLAHSQAKVLFVDSQLLNIASEAIHILSKTGAKPPSLILITNSESNESEKQNAVYDYEQLLANGDEQFQPELPKDECDPISVNYTSGTTSRPKVLSTATEVHTLTLSQHSWFIKWALCRLTFGPSLCFIAMGGVFLGESRLKVAQTFAYAKSHKGHIRQHCLT
ncbi:putative acyl-activating enzyme 2 [Bienertia sinuspersici]